MSDHSDQDLNPTTFRARLTELQLKNAKILAASLKITLREFWEEAMKLHILEREKSELSGKPFQYALVPRNAKFMPVYADLGLLNVLDTWAKKDDVSKHDAIYTAFSRHIELRSKQFTGLET